MAGIALLIFGFLPFWAGFGYLVVIVWSGWLLYRITFSPDPLSQAIRRQVELNPNGK